MVKDGFELLSFESESTISQNWRDILSEYKKSETIDSDRFSFTLIASGVNEEKSNVDHLKSACKSLVDSEDDSDSSYVKARRWCVIPKTVKEILGKKTLKYETGEKDDDGAWVKKIGKYDHSKLPLSGITWPMEGDDKKIEELKKGCKSLLEKTTKTYSQEFTKEYDTGLSWCIA